MTKLNVAEASRRFPDLLERVVEDGDTILITREGRAIAKLVPAIGEDEPAHPADIKGWLDEDDPFFSAVNEIVEARFLHQPRAFRGDPDEGTS
jgi:prevent-host-death family protein